MIKNILIALLLACPSYAADTFELRDPSDNSIQGTIDDSDVLDMIGGYTDNGSNVLGNDVTGNAGTSTALAANGANCSANNYPLGVDASGAVESCTADANTNAQTECTGSESLRGDGSCTAPSGGGLSASADETITGSWEFAGGSTTTFTGAIKSPQAISAFVVFVGTESNGTNKTLMSAYGVDSVTKNSDADYTVNFSTPFITPSHYVCTCTASNDSSSFVNCGMDPLTEPTDSTWTLNTRSGSGSIDNASNVNVMCAGYQ